MERNLVNGNTVLKPEKYTQDNNKNKKNKKVKREKIYIKNKGKTLKSILLVFVIGVILVSRYCIIYSMQKGVNNIKNQIEDLNKENENLRVELVKYNNIQFIEEKSVKDFKMIAPSRENAIYCDLDKNNFREHSNKDKDKKGLLEEIKKAITGVK